MTTEIILPWPHKLLWPNGSEGNRYAKGREAKKYKEYAFYVTKEARIGIEAGAVPILIAMTFHPKTANLPDGDNCIAGMKHALDGIALALGVNDRDFRIAEPIIAEPVKGGRVVVSIT